MDGASLKLPAPIQFEPGTDELLAESEDALLHVAEFLKAKSYVTSLRVEGHTEGSESAIEEQELSKARALAVCSWLVARGIPCEHLVPVGFGASKPVADPRTPSGKAENRRVVFAPAAIRGKPMGGMPVDGGGEIAGSACDKE